MSFSLQLEQNICTGIDLYVCVCGNWCTQRKFSYSFWWTHGRM